MVEEAVLVVEVVLVVDEVVLVVVVLEVVEEVVVELAEALKTKVVLPYTVGR